MFSRVTMGFGVALIAMSVLAAVGGATTTGSVAVPAVIGGFFVVFGWLDRRIAPPESGRLQSLSRYPIIGAAVLVFSSARGITLILDTPDSGATPSGTEAFLIVTVVAGIAYIMYGAWSEIAEARRGARARAARARAAAAPASAVRQAAPGTQPSRSASQRRRRTRR